MKVFIKNMFTAGNPISTKRVCGFLGWIVAMIALVYATATQSPHLEDMYEIFCICVM